MILTPVQLLDVLTKNPNKDLLKFGSDQRKRARMHLYGVGMQYHLSMIEGFEKPWAQAIRVKYVQSNKDIFARLTKPVTKVFTARGGSSYYNLSPKENESASILDNNVFRDTSVKKWTQTYWKNRMMDDPMGVTFMEIDSTGRTYPTFKCVDAIFDYQENNGRLEYIVFKLETKQKIQLGLEDKSVVYRVVDDAFDKIVILEDTQDAKSIREVDGQTFPNYFGFVPARINSYLPNPDGPGYITPLYWVLDLADQYLMKISIRLTHELRHGFPKYWEFADDCIKCKGTGRIRGKDHAECQGTGKKLMTYVSDLKLLEYPTKDTPAIKGAPGGYIEPSEIFWKIITQSLTELEDKMYQTLWGSKTTTKMKPGMGLSGAPNGSVTATEVMDNRQPETEVLNDFSDAAEKIDKFIVDCLITLGLKKSSYIPSGGCSKNYGRRFLIEEPDALLERYMTAREKGLSPGILFGMYEQYLEAKYQSDGVSLSLQKKLLQVEPFMHYTLDQVKSGGFDPVAIRAKIFYGEWLASMNSAVLIASSVQALKAQLETFLTGKPLPKIEDPEAKKKTKTKA